MTLFGLCFARSAEPPVSAARSSDVGLLACVRQGHEQKTGGNEPRGQHDFVDVAVLRPGAGFSMLTIEPDAQ